jgi:hypothetical protein
MCFMELEAGNSKSIIDRAVAPVEPFHAALCCASVLVEVTVPPALTRCGAPSRRRQRGHGPRPRAVAHRGHGGAVGRVRGGGGGDAVRGPAR